MKDKLKSEVKKTYGSWKKSETSDGVTISISVDEVENGYVVEYEKYGNIGKNKEWDSTRKKYISKTNPLEKEPNTKKDEFDDSIESLKQLFS
jgi:pyruvoyl-dependent arginine decarboxylase (PvlArgDC)